MSLGESGFDRKTKRTRKREFLDEMERVVPWQALVELINPYAPEGKRGRPPFAVETMLRAYSTRWRTRFHADGGQCSSVMADSVPR